jgi:hypothetical protein
LTLRSSFPYNQTIRTAEFSGRGAFAAKSALSAMTRQFSRGSQCRWIT